MGKRLLVISFATLIFLAFGTELAPDSPLFWLASSSTGYQVIRFGLMLILLLQLGTEPPRHRVVSSCVSDDRGLHRAVDVKGYVCELHVTA